MRSSEHSHGGQCGAEDRAGGRDKVAPSLGATEPIRLLLLLLQATLVTVSLQQACPLHPQPFPLPTARLPYCSCSAAQKPPIAPHCLQRRSE